MTTTVGIVAGQLVIGGAERQLYLWLANLDRQRFRPVVATLHPNSADYWESRIEALDIPLIRVSRGRSRISRLTQLVHLFRPFRPQLLHGWHLFASPYAGAAARILRARASLGSLRSSYRSYRRHRSEALLTSWLTDGLLVNSHAAAAQIRYGGGGKAHRLFVVPNAVEDEVAGRAEARLRFAARWNADSRRLWIGSMGRLDADKRFHALLDIVASLTRRGYDLQLILIGYGDGLEALNEAARSLGIADRVVVSGPDPDARKWLSALDVFCFPSTDEGLPNAVMEAAVAGVPIVGWRTDFLAELLGGSGAALAEPGDRAGLEDAVARLLERPEERLQLGREARQRMSNQYGVNRLIERMTSVYEELLSPNGGGRP